ncbi:MAG: hypothetical protein ABIY63_13410 [Fibrobacteria bacterium]
MKMTERIGPHYSGINHQGRRYSPKELVRKGLPSFSGGMLGVSQAELVEMVKAFRAANGCDPSKLFHTGMMGSAQQVCVLVPGETAVWLRQESGREENWLE